MFEDQLIRKITGGIAAIKRGDKSPEDAKLGGMLNTLKGINLPMHEELMNNYKAALEIYKGLKEQA